jgi:Leu/Phe-tRNA-protein transferase
MDEADKELEAIKDEAQRHRKDAEKAWAQANIQSAYETVSREGQAKKAEKKQAKEEEAKARKKR